MKRIIFLLVFVLLGSFVNAVSVDTHKIVADVHENGFAEITETYNLSFTSPFEKNEFDRKAVENSSSIQAWQFDYAFFYPRFGGTIDKLASSTISYDRESQNLIFSYTLKEMFSTLITSEQRSDFFTIDDKQLSAFNDSGTIVIPENTTFIINLPQNSEIDSSNLPEKAIVTGTSVSLSGIQSNSISLDYRILKPIAPSNFNFFADIYDIYFIILPIVALLAIMIFLKKDTIEEKIENYLVNHSEIKNRKPEEDINFDLD